MAPRILPAPAVTARIVPKSSGMALRLTALLLLVAALAACGVRRGAGAPAPTAAVQPAAATTPLSAAATAVAVTPRPAALISVAGLQDVGQLVVPAGGVVQADNRAAASGVRLAAGDLVRLPPGMIWGPPPGVGISPEYELAMSATPAGAKLYVWLLFGDGGAHVVQADDRTFRVDAPGEALIYANDEQIGVNGLARDHGVAVDPAGHLLLDPAPAPGDAVVYYTTGQGLDVHGMTAIGRLAAAQQSGFGAFYFTVCEAGTCGFTYRTSQVVAPIAGSVTCESGADFDLRTADFTLQFRDTDLVRKNWPPGLPSPTPGACGASRSVQAGDVIATGFTHYLVHAVSGSGEPLSVVVANDGTIYVGQVVVPPFDGPGRAT